MIPKRHPKSAPIPVRLTPEVRARVLRAATLDGMTASEWIRSALLAALRRVEAKPLGRVT